MNTYYVPNNFHNITNSSDLLHDYLYFTIKDILISKNIPVITKNDICTNIILSRLFQGETPDIFTVSNRKLYCFDIFSKYNQYSIYDQEDIISWRNKYEKVKLFCDFEIIDVQNLPKKIARGLFFSLLLAAFFSWKSYNPNLHDPDYTRFQKITAEVENQFSKNLAEPRPELFIAHNALAEYFTFTTGVDAMPWLPEYAVDSSRLWRIAAGVHGQTLRYFSGTENGQKIKNLGGGYFLLPEYVWQNALHNAKLEKDEYFLKTAESWLNPYRMRPAFLLKRKG